MDDKNKLETELRKTLIEIKRLISEDKWNNDNDGLWTKMVDLAHKLHGLVNPKHHKYMIENRGCSADDREFYNHIHPVEDLLAYMKDPHANDDPEDKTIDHKFSLKIFSRRWGHDDTYKVTRTNAGWIIGNISISGVCDKSGSPYLFENLRHDSINYPEALSGYMEWLWEQAAEEGLTHEQVQNSLNQLGEWISICEKNSPNGVWEAYK